MGEGGALHHVGCRTKDLNLIWFRGGGESDIYPPPLFPLPPGEGIFLKCEKKILRTKVVRS
jgi:hypothetical protein